jgi:hypothetical protein
LIQVSGKAVKLKTYFKNNDEVMVTAVFSQLNCGGNPRTIFRVCLQSSIDIGIGKAGLWFCQLRGYFLSITDEMHN